MEEAEPAIQPRPTRIEVRLNRALERAASVLTSVVALLLIVFVVVALVAVVTQAASLLVEGHGFAEAALQGVDTAFLAIILLELVHTTLSRGPIQRQLQEFLVIGITAGVRSGLEVAASAQKGNPRDVVINLSINAAGVLVLVGALWLVRQGFRVEHAPGASNDEEQNLRPMG